ncbi:MAG: ACT domain-containing protein [Clostridiaceae bacterium]|nr:ACT domain-containing protein [Clostridiaceae bacterium]
MKAFITVIGDDKIGIIHGVTSILKKNNVNVLDINQTLLQDYFAMMMLVDLKEMSLGFKELKQELQMAGNEIGVTIKIQHEDIFNTMHTV